MNFCKTPPLLRVCLRVLTLVLTLTLALTLAPANTARAAGTWLRLTSEHFDMLSCTSERSSRKMLVQLEQFREFFFKIIPQGRCYDPRPMILVFDTDRQYKPYESHGPDGRPVPSVGLFVKRPLESRILMVNEHIAQGLATIFHEYTHSLMHARLGEKIPPWFDEGLAQVYETFEVDGDKVTFGRVDTNNVYVLANERFLPLGTLFAVDGKSEYYNEQHQMSVFYADSWLLMHYAMCGNKSGVYDFDNMLRFMKESSLPGADTSRVFAGIFGSDYEKLEYALDDYMNAGSYTGFTSTVPARPIQDKITVRLATNEELEIELAGARWSSSGAADAGEIMSGLMNKYPDNPRVYEILAGMKMSEGEMAGATDYLRKAVEKKSTNPMVYVWLLQNYFSAGPDLPPGGLLPADKAAEYTRLVDRALELAPDCMDACKMLAVIESQKADVRIGKMNEVLKALPDIKEPASTYLAVATVYWRLKRYSEAEAVINEMSKNPESSYYWKRKASELLRLIVAETGKEPPPQPPPKNAKGKKQ